MKIKQQIKPTSRITINHILIIVVALLIGVQVTISNKIATSGNELKELETKAQRIEEENQQLLAESVEYMSLAQLSQKAEEMGFTEAEEVIDLSAAADTLALK